MGNIKFILRKINTEQFATIERETELNPNVEIQLNLNIGFGIDMKNKLLGCFLHIQYEYEETPIVILKLNCEFEVEAKVWNEFIDKKNKKIKFPKAFLQHLAVITIGTARGVLHSKTEGTIYNNFFLPTINVTEIVTEDEGFILDQKF